MKKGRDREKTGSVTKLVKIIAAEVFDEKIKGVIEELQPCWISKEDLEEVTRTSFDNICLSLEKAGKPWSEGEDDLLYQELKVAVKKIAQNHGRTYGAITARIRQKHCFD